MSSCERPGRILSREQLLDLTQGRDAAAFDRSVDVLMSRIRRKLGDGRRDAAVQDGAQWRLSAATRVEQTVNLP